ncbi:MAG: ArsR family transcriptional regulator [Saprospiraceae bacterium]|nr:MAG: hypothetical protein UZ09_BCD002000251 [Bacteroidetes bacterium OLB9]MCO6464287.1 ArsR family transcriptional regulator [Saprospiraceae bacterium]MCZ2337859.1 hypothetical protein [Chitinophagales bacterium]
MLETLISSKTRIKLLLRFFLNSKSTAYLRGLENEFGESTNAIRLELNRFEDAGMLSSFSRGNKKYFKANTEHPLYNDVHNLLLKYIGFDKIIDNVIENLGDISKVYVTGAFASGLDHHTIDLVFIGNINKTYLAELIEKVERHIHRRIRYIVYSSKEIVSELKTELEENSLLLWQN